MATCPVRFEFNCEKAPEKLIFIHDVPRMLVTRTAAEAQNDPKYVETFAEAIRPIMLGHEAQCRALSHPKCRSCGSPTVKVLLTPMSWLHIVDDPFVNVWTNPVCDKAACEMLERQKISDMMALMSSAPVSSTGGSSTGTALEIMPCKVCGDTKETKRCGQCKSVAYCGREHQKADWKSHKEICNMLRSKAP